jgi:hypothetical protein
VPSVSKGGCFSGPATAGLRSIQGGLNKEPEERGAKKRNREATIETWASRALERIGSSGTACELA